MSRWRGFVSPKQRGLNRMTSRLWNQIVSKEASQTNIQGHAIQTKVKRGGRYCVEGCPGSKLHKYKLYYWYQHAPVSIRWSSSAEMGQVRSRKWAYIQKPKQELKHFFLRDYLQGLKKWRTTIFHITRHVPFKVCSMHWHLTYTYLHWHQQSLIFPSTSMIIFKYFLNSETLESVQPTRRTLTGCFQGKAFSQTETTYGIRVTYKTMEHYT